jgi:hypothetical protein
MSFLSRVKIVAGAVPKISPQEAKDKGLFGPVYHGTSEDNRSKIEQDGFKVHIGDARTEGISHGYEMSDYQGGIPAPIHHLGFGVYLTTVKAIGKKFNNDSVKGLKVYYLDVPKKEEINFGATKTMMKWWQENGYDMKPVGSFTDPKLAKDRLKATVNLTNHLKSKYDAVWFKGKGIHTLLDGDQIVVFDPKRIYEVDPKLAKSGEIGGKVKRKSDGMIGVVLDSRDIEEKFREFHPEATKFLHVKWKKGGTTQTKDNEIEPLE